MIYTSDNRFLKSIIQNKENMYCKFSIPKKNGKGREICAPNLLLKNIQTEILYNLLYPNKDKLHEAACAFVQDKNIASAVHPHVRQKKLLCVDIEDFFGSISYKKILDVFYNILKLPEETASLYSELCTLDGHLPQGAPTSPALSNFVCKKLDKILFGFCYKRNINYTRYADDMFFSGDFDEKEVIRAINAVFHSYYDFRINYKKLHVMRQSQRQIIMGLLVNDSIRLTKEKRRSLRQTAYYMQKFGILNYAVNQGLADSDLNSLFGYVSYARRIEPDNADAKMIYDMLHDYIRIFEPI